MARGWESKHVERQQEDAQRTPARTKPPAEAPDVRSRRATLELSRARARADLAAAQAPAHRQMLERAIEALDTELATLG